MKTILQSIWENQSVENLINVIKKEEVPSIVKEGVIKEIRAYGLNFPNSILCSYGLRLYFILWEGHKRETYEANEKQIPHLYRTRDLSHEFNEIVQAWNS